VPAAGWRGVVHSLLRQPPLPVINWADCRMGWGWPAGRQTVNSEMKAPERAASVPLRTEHTLPMQLHNLNQAARLVQFLHSDKW
jgi:hypothetical protein